MADQPLNPTLARLLRPLAGLASPGGSRGRLSILIYHRVLPAADPLYPDVPTADEFRWQMRLLAEQFNPLPLPQALRRLYSGELPPRAVAVSFDDGYADNLHVALPVLEQTGVPATFFIASGFINGGRMWNDTVVESVRRLPAGRYRPPPSLELEAVELDDIEQRRRLCRRLIGALKYRPLEQRQQIADEIAAAVGELPNGLMLDERELRQLHRSPLATIGGHTDSHPILTRISDDQAHNEIRRGKERLEGWLDAPVRLFAYPNGRPDTDYRPAHARLVEKAGFEAALSTAWGVATADTDRWQIPRFTPWDRTPLRFWQRILRNCRQLH